METRFVLGMFLGALVFSQGAVAATSTTTETDGQNHVTIVINQNGHKPKKVAKNSTKNKTSSKKKIVAAKKPVARPIAKKQIVAAAPVVVPSHIPMGKRVTLANQGYAHANGYNGTEENQIMPNSSSLPSAPNLVQKLKKQEKEEETASAWGFKYRSYNAVDMNALENYGNSRDYTIRAWDRASISYNVNPDVSVILMPQYYHTWGQDSERPQSSNNPGLNQSYASFLGDTGLYFDDKNIASFGGTVTTSKTGVKKADSPFVLGGSQSYFAPTSESSETAGMLGETRTNLNLSKSFGKLDLKWTEELRYYIQQYSTNSFIGLDGNAISNTAYRVLNLLDIGFNFTSKLNFTLETGVINEYDYGDASTNLNPAYVDYFVMNPDLSYSFNKNFGLDLGIWEVYNYTNPPTVGGTKGENTASYSPFAPYNGTNGGSWTTTELFLMGTVKF